MVFSSLQFIFIFIPIFFICYYSAPRTFRNAVLLLGSLCVYFIGTINNPEHFIIFIISMLVDFAAALCIEKYPKFKRMFLLIGIIFHLISLFTFKYMGFVLGEIEKYNAAFTFTKNIVLPIGISFYTFQGISYITDVYRGKVTAEKS